MKKILFSFLVLSLIMPATLASCDDKCDKYKNKHNKIETTCPKDKEKCEIEDDEYCVYNECFFDKHFKKMKKTLCLTNKQESCIDNIYRDFKDDMENYHTKYRIQKNKILEMIECNNDCYKNEIKNLKELSREIKERCKDFRDDIKAQLCKNQYSTYRKFLRCEKKKMKKIIKYGAIYKLPCVNCCNK